MWAAVTQLHRSELPGAGDRVLAHSRLESIEPNKTLHRGGDRPPIAAATERLA